MKEINHANTARILIDLCRKHHNLAMEIRAIDRLIAIDPAINKREVLALFIQSALTNLLRSNPDLAGKLSNRIREAPSSDGLILAVKEVIGVLRGSEDDSTMDILYDGLFKISPGEDKREAIQICIRLKETFFQKGDFDAAIGMLDKIKEYGGRTDDSDMWTAEVLYAKGEYGKAREIALRLVKSFGNNMATDYLSIAPYVSIGECFLLMNDVWNAEGEFQKYLAKATVEQKNAARAKLEYLVARKVNIPDASYLLKKLFLVDETIVDTDQRRSVETKPKLLESMIVSEFGSSEKVNLESEKALLVVRSQVSRLRFDSNRKILGVRQVTEGDWELWLPAGTHILKIDADGFNRLELPPMNFGRKRSYELGIKVAPPETE